MVTGIPRTVLTPPTAPPPLPPQELGLGTHWDDDLSYLLFPALTAYELERCTGLSVGNEEFQDAIHNVVPLGHTFKGFPIQLTFWNPKRVFSVCTKFSTCLRLPFPSLTAPSPFLFPCAPKRSQVCTDILSCRGDQVRMAVRTKLCDYPEGVCAVWIMFAVKYKSVL